jgi:carbon-monoxide dehydrogenase large subunit
VDLGAYFSQLTPITATGVGAPVQGGAYRFEAIEINVLGIFTNKVPVDAYRGAGRPEATYVLERLIDRAAAELKIDPAELRAQPAGFGNGAVHGRDRAADRRRTVSRQPAALPRAR